MPHRFSDSFTTFPPRESRQGLGLVSSRKEQIFQRGTVSMPTSPVLRASANPLLWEGATPLSASAQEDLFSPLPPSGGMSGDRPFSASMTDPSPALGDAFGGDNGTSSGLNAYHDHPYPSALFSAPPLDSSFPHHGHGSHFLEEDMEEGDAGGAGPPRKKRAQVRIACTHCQKACKKCSNTRPCERCVRYGLKDCVDSTRKPRKTGIKRGPYKRRSSKYALSPSSLGSHSRGVGDPEQQELGGMDWWDPSPHHQQQQQQHQDSFNPPNTGMPSHSHIPPPRTAGPSSSSQSHSLHSAAFSAAFGNLGARWINGQRVHDPAPPPPPPQGYLPAHDVSRSSHNNGNASAETFPLSLHHFSDPFSRAVSPIRQSLPLSTTSTWAAAPPPPPPPSGIPEIDALRSVLYPNLEHPGQTPLDNTLGASVHISPDHSAHGDQADGTGDIEMDSISAFASTSASASASASADASPLPSAAVSGSATPIIPEVPVTSTTTNPFFSFSSNRKPTLPWDAQILSAPTSPRQRPSSLPYAPPRASSAEPPDSSMPHQHGHLGSAWTRFNSGGPGGVHSPALIALKKIRKPSLKTLMSPMSSAGPSRAGSPSFPSGIGTFGGLTMGPMGGMGGMSGIAESEREIEVEQSPTLFDQPMALDDVPPLAWDLPDGGEGGVESASVIPSALEQGHETFGPPAEGLGLMGLEGVFQT